MSAMVESLLDYARIGSGAPSFADVNLADCVSQAAQLLQSELRAVSASLNQQGLGTIRGDHTLLTRLFLNLISNAVKYRKPATTPKIEFIGDDEGGKVTIKVRDNGIGVDPQHAARSRPAMKLRTNVFSFISTPTTPSPRSAAARWPTLNRAAPIFGETWSEPISSIMSRGISPKNSCASFSRQCAGATCPQSASTDATRRCRSV